MWDRECHKCKDVNFFRSRFVAPFSCNCSCTGQRAIMQSSAPDTNFVFTGVYSVDTPTSILVQKQNSFLPICSVSVFGNSRYTLELFRIENNDETIAASSSTVGNGAFFFWEPSVLAANNTGTYKCRTSPRTQSSDRRYNLTLVGKSTK